jgi:hypothetical protein
LYPSARLNKGIKSNNAVRKIPMKLVTEKEWWTFHALILTAPQLGSGKIFEKTHYGLLPEPNLKGYMPERRFKDIRSMFPYAFYDCDEDEVTDEEFLKKMAMHVTLGIGSTS